MKKFYQTSKYKKYNRRHARRSERTKIRKREFKRLRNRALLGLSKKEKQYKLEVKDPHADFKKIHAPENFSFIQNPEEMSGFIKKLEAQLEKKKKVFVRLVNVKKMDHDAVVVLLSIMFKFKSSKIDFNGDLPQNQEAKSLLIDSGFLSYLFQRALPQRNTYNVNQTKEIHTHASKTVESALGKKIIERITPIVWKERRMYKGFQRTLIELMQNTNNHADNSAEGVKHWWLSVNLLPSEKKATFAFIDYGVGIFASLSGKGPQSKFYKIFDKLSGLFKFETNADLIKLILNGDVHKTASNQYFRGKGLPGIKEAMDRKQISRLVIISNNVFANVEKDEYKLLTVDFSGTYIYWELNEHSEYFPWTTSQSA